MRQETEQSPPGFPRNTMFFVVWALLLCSGGSSSSEKQAIVSLQQFHPPTTPGEIFGHLSEECQRLGVDQLDVYGDFHLSESFLSRFECMLAQELGKEDAVFMPSGVVAQSIALLVHRERQQKKSFHRTRFACHHSSHLLLHEQEAYRKLLGMEPVIISTVPTRTLDSEHRDFLEVPPLTFRDVYDALEHPLEEDQSNERRVRDEVSTLLLELPHRELGGKLTPWSDVLKMRDYCHNHGLAFHCDGARLFEASAGYSETLRGLAEPFDSVYLSFYKGLGGLAGAVLLGDKEFCEEARLWLRRFGGNLFTLMPYIVSAYSGYERYWLLKPSAGRTGVNSAALSFVEKRDKLRRIVKVLQEDPSISSIVRFDPLLPETNMVHGYLRGTEDECNASIEQVAAQVGVRVLHRIRGILPPGDEDDENTPSADNLYHASGYRTKFEWTMGEANGRIPDTAFVRGWKAFAGICSVD
jgi:threonine aldolase